MKKILLFFISLLLLTSCSSPQEENSLSCELFYMGRDLPTLLEPKDAKLRSETLDDAVSEIIELLKFPEEKKAVSALPRTISLRSVEISGADIYIDLSIQYMQLPLSTRAIANACITNSLCSMDGVERVFISCEGMPPTPYTMSDFVTDKPHVYYNSQTINLYFADESFEGLVRNTITSSTSQNKPIELIAISALISGPETDTARKAIPDGTLLNDIYIKDGVCTIDFSPEFVLNAEHNKTSEAVTLFSIVNTMTELPLVNSVKFLIDGNDGYGYAFFDISKPLTNASDLFK